MVTGDRANELAEEREGLPQPNYRVGRDGHQVVLTLYGRRFRLGAAEACSIAECLKMAAASTVDGRLLPDPED